MTAEGDRLGRVDRLRLDYQQTTDLLRTLNDVRFKLLALVPTLSGAAVAVVGHPGPAADLLGVGLLGLAATTGVLIYELRNSELYDYGCRRAERLEAELGFTALGGAGTGGPFTERPPRTLRLFGVATVDRERGLAFVYSSALAGWTYLVVWGLLRALGIHDARIAGGAIGLAVGLLLLVELIRIHGDVTSASPAPSRSRTASLFH
jgi:hypothetical protein